MKNVLFECQLSMHILRGSTNFQAIFILHKTLPVIEVTDPGIFFQ